MKIRVRQHVILMRNVPAAETAWPFEGADSGCAEELDDPTAARIWYCTLSAGHHGLHVEHYTDSSDRLMVGVAWQVIETEHDSRLH